MLKRTTNTLVAFADVLPARGPYSLQDVRLDITSPTTAVFRAKVCGPAGAAVWARAWLSNDVGTLAEIASSEMRAGDAVTLQVTLEGAELPQAAYMRIESAPLATEHVVAHSLVDQ